MAIVPKLRRGDLSECSFAFRATQQAWNEDKTQRAIRACTIHRGDVSIVTTAANPNATASLRAERLTLEQRERIAERVGNRVCGPYSAGGYELDAPSRSHALMPSYVGIARAKAARARLGGSRRASLPNRPHAKPRYTYAEIQHLGKDGKAHKKADGSYNFPVVDERDIIDAVHAINRTPAGERLSVKRFVVYRAEVLGLKAAVPGDWKAEVYDALHP